MARALVSAMAIGVLRAVSRWGSKAALRTQCPGRSNARQWVASGVRVFLDMHRRRTARAHTALAAMSAMTKQRGELFPPAEGEHTAACSDNDSDTRLSQEHVHSKEVYETQPLQWDMRHQWPWPLSKSLGTCAYVAEREVLVDLKDVPKSKGIRLHRPLLLRCSIPDGTAGHNVRQASRASQGSRLRPLCCVAPAKPNRLCMWPHVYTAPGANRAP